MKKIFAFIISATMVFYLSGCTNSKNTQQDYQSTTSTEYSETDKYDIPDGNSHYVPDDVSVMDLEYGTIYDNMSVGYDMYFKGLPFKVKGVKVFESSDESYYYTYVLVTVDISSLSPDYTDDFIESYNKDYDGSAVNCFITESRNYYEEEQMHFLKNIFNDDMMEECILFDITSNYSLGGAYCELQFSIESEDTWISSKDGEKAIISQKENDYIYPLILPDSENMADPDDIPGWVIN